MTEEYLLNRRVIIRNKFILTAIVSIVILTIITVINFNINYSGNIFVLSLRLAIFTCLLIFVFCKMITYFKMYKNIDYLKRKEIERTDERNILINLKSSAITLKAIILILACTAIISSFYSVVLFYNNIILLVIFLLIKIIVHFIYNKSS